MVPYYMLSSQSDQSLSPSPRFSSLSALSVSAFSPLASPFGFELSTVNSLSLRSAHQYHSTALTHPLFSYSYALFCHSENDKLFVFRRFHTLCPKHPGGAYPLQPRICSFRNPTTPHSALATNPSIIRTYEKPARNPFRIRTYKKTGGGAAVVRGWYRPATSLAPFFKGQVGETATLDCLFPDFTEHGALIRVNESPVTAMPLLCREFAGGLGIRVECNRHGDRALAARRKSPLPHRFLGGFRQSRVPSKDFDIFDATIRVNSNFQAHSPPDAPALQDGRIVHIYLFHYFAVMVIVLRPATGQAHQRQDEARDYRGVANPALRFCHHAALKQRCGTPVGDHPHHCVFLCRTNVAVF